MSDTRDQSDLLNRYLLGVVSDEERRVVEDQVFASDTDINVLLQAEDELIDDYVRGALSTSYRRLFESHFLCTESRRQRLETVESLVEVLAQVASERRRRPLSIVMPPAQNYANSHQVTRGPALALNRTYEWFDSLLHWLDPDREKAGEKYEAIRQRLIKFFTVKGNNYPEALADETFDRVASKLAQMKEKYVGDPAVYFLAVARMVSVEGPGQQAPARTLASAANTSAEDQTYSCFEKCLEQLPESDRELILQCYGVEKGKTNLKKLAASLGMPVNALRIRVVRIRRKLEDCIRSCQEEKS